MTNFLLILTICFLFIQTFVIYQVIKFTRKFLEEIKSIRGIQFGSYQIGDEAPLFRVQDINDNKLVLKDLIEHQKVLLLFINSECQTCQSILNNIKNLEMYNVNIIIINNDENLHIQEIPSNSYYVYSPHLFSTYQISRTPSCVLVDRNQKIEFISVIEDIRQIEISIINESLDKTSVI